MSDNDCSIMESWCLERARTDPKNRGKWLAQSERWHELARAEFVATSKEAFPAVNARRANDNATASAGLVFNPLKKEPRTALVIWR
jgi:hypothetical protein